jgi:hypothetical protein
MSSVDGYDVTDVFSLQRGADHVVLLNRQRSLPFTFHVGGSTTARIPLNTAEGLAIRRSLHGGQREVTT